VSILVFVIVAALVQGITEFLPVSSSGHLRVSGHLFEMPAANTLLDVILHLATLLAVLWVFRKAILRVFVPASQSEGDDWQGSWQRLFLLVFVGSVPAGLLGVLAGDTLEGYAASLRFVGGAYLVNGVILLIAHRYSRKGDGGRKLSEMTLTHSFIIGLAQALAVTRGISRSGSTITASIILGYRAEAAAFFSFLLAIPVIGGAAFLELYPVLKGSESIDFPLSYLLLGFGIAFFVGILALNLLLASVKRAIWLPYVVYSFGLSAVCFLL
jgi:undecaprenyl-diphosphatase